MKTFRVYFILKRRHAKSKNTLSDRVLILITAGIVLGDIVIAHPFFIVGVLNNDINFVTNEQMPSDITVSGHSKI